MSGKWGEISETLKRRCVYICCLQEVRWKTQDAKMIGDGFNFLWSGGCKAENGVGVIISCYCLQAGRPVNEEGCGK